MTISKEKYTEPPLFLLGRVMLAKHKAEFTLLLIKKKYYPCLLI